MSMTTCLTSLMVPVSTAAGTASALRMLAGNPAKAAVATVVFALRRRKLRRSMVMDALLVKLMKLVKLVRLVLLLRAADDGCYALRRGRLSRVRRLV